MIAFTAHIGSRRTVVNNQARGLLRQLFEMCSLERVRKSSQGAIMTNRAFDANRSRFSLASCLLTLGLLTSIPAFSQTFDHVPQLAFTKQFAGANPLPQILTVASTGANFSFSATATTSTGGSWLIITPGGTGCCVTPEAITVTVSAPAALAAGTYTGTITVTQYPSATVKMNIPVTLTVASGGAFFDNVPGALSFSLKTGGAAPPYQPVQVRGAGTGTLSWTVATSTADGGGWLHVAPATSGVAPSNLQVSIVPTSLPGGGLTAGTFVGELVFTATGSSVTIPISVAVGGSVFDQATSLSFTMPLGGANPLPQVLSIASTGSNINFSVTSATATGGAWLQASPPGTGCCVTPEAITVSITAPAGLAAGSYTGEVIITQYSSRNLSMIVPVVLTVAPSTVAFLDNLPGQLSFSLKTGGAAPPTQTVQIRSQGTGTLGWAAVKGTADGGSWLSVSATQGTAPSTLSVSIAPASLPGGGSVAGTFVGQILIATATSRETIPISVVVGASVFNQVNPLSFTMPLGGANPLPQVLSIASTGSNINFSVTSATATGGAWLQASPPGTGCCVTPEAITVSITAPAGLAAGSYTGEVIITQYSSKNLSMIVPVTLTVAPSGVSFLDNLPGQLSFSLKTGGAAPPAQAVQILSKGTATLGWALMKDTADGGSWLSVSAAQGNAPSTVSVSIAPGSLPNGGLVAGTFVGQILIATATSRETIPVSVVVGDSVFSQVNPLSFTMPLGGANPLPQTLSIASTGSNINFSVTSATATGGAWLQVSPPGTGCCLTPEAITVSITAPAGLAAGSYTGEVIITQYSSRNLSMIVPVVLTVVSGQPFLDNLPGELSFSLKTGGQAPPSQLVQIRNAATGTLSWSLSLSTADGGAWLGATITQGTAPSTVAISIVPGNLPNGGLVAGTFVGQVDITTASGSATIPVSVVVGDSVFSQVNPINFTMPLGGSNPLPQILTVASTGATFDFSSSSSTATGGNWLQITPPGTGCCATPEAIMVSVTAPPGLPAGTYTGEVVLTVYSNRSFSMTVPVTLTVAPSSTAFLDNLTGELSFFLKTGGSAPPYQPVQINNGGTGTLDWTATKSTSDGGNWLNISATQGAAPSTLAVSITPANLPGGGLVAGTFVGQVLITTASSQVSIPVNVVIGDPVFSQVNPLRFTMPAGGANPLPQIVTAASTSSAVSFTALAETGTGGSWLQISPQGTGCCATPEAITVSVVAPSGLPAGTYTGEIILVSYSNRNMSMAIPVTLTVAPTGAFFDNVIGQLGFFISTGGGAPPNQVVELRNGGAGTLTWRSVKSTADSGSWLGVSSATGTAPSSVTVSINPANLPNGGLVAGTYIGEVLFAATGDGVTVPVSVVVGDPGFVTAPSSLSFSMSAGGINPPSQSLAITSTGSAISFSATAASGTGGTWLHISPQGTGCCSTGSPITVSVVAPSGLPAGSYTGEISIIQYSNRNKAVTVPVYLTVH